MTVSNPFLTQSELIEPVLPQEAQLSIHFLLHFFHNTLLEMYLLLRDMIKDTPLVKEEIKKKSKEEEKKPSNQRDSNP